GVLRDLELAVLALGDDVLGVLLTIGDLLGYVLHQRIVRPDRIRGKDIDVGQLRGHRDRLAAADQGLLFRRCDPDRGCRISIHYSSPPPAPTPISSCPPGSASRFSAAVATPIFATCS